VEAHRNILANSASERPLRLLRLPEVCRRTGRSRSAIYRDASEGTFPKPVRASERSVAWVEGEIEDWIAQRIAASRAPVSA
jgi:prophage regulatory protein